MGLHSFPIVDLLGKKTWVDKNGKRHREDGPAVIWPNGEEIWYIHGKMHREDGPAYINKSNGETAWYYEGKHHRKNGPAIIWNNGTKFWFLHGKRHREDGPAKEWSSGRKEYWINGKKLTKEKFKKYVSSKNK